LRREKRIEFKRNRKDGTNLERIDQGRIGKRETPLEGEIVLVG